MITGPQESVTETALVRAGLTRTDREEDGWGTDGPTRHRLRVVCLLGTDVGKN